MTVSRAPFDCSTRKYAFIDGENLRHIFDQQHPTLKDRRDAYVENYVRVVTILAKEMGVQGPYAAMYARLYRAYYYDAPLGDDHADHERQRVVLDRIEATTGFHVRPGTARRRKGSRVEQKEVDVLLAVDMLSHAYRGNMHVALLISNDLDFRPAIEECTRHGIYVVLGGNSDTPAELRSSADEFYDISAVVNRPPS